LLFLLTPLVSCCASPLRVLSLYSRRPDTPLCLSFFLSCYGDHRDLHSFPTRRSSDLSALAAGRSPNAPQGAIREVRRRSRVARRSEEHTSELQSRENLVCRLLLEKKKTTTKYEVAADIVEMLHELYLSRIDAADEDVD